MLTVSITGIAKSHLNLEVLFAFTDIIKKKLINCLYYNSGLPVIFILTCSRQLSSIQAHFTFYYDVLDQT